MDSAVPGAKESSRNQQPSTLMKPDEVAALLRVPTSWVYTHQKEIPGLVRLGRYVRFRRSDIAKLIQTDLPCVQM